MDCHAGNPCVYVLDLTVQNLYHKEEKNGGIGFKLGERDLEAWKLHIKLIKGALKSKKKTELKSASKPEVVVVAPSVLTPTPVVVASSAILMKVGL
ncbi:hypothetical protein Tco_0852145 [Tanacetum coccineum]